MMVIMALYLNNKDKTIEILTLDELLKRVEEAIKHTYEYVERYKRIPTCRELRRESEYIDLALRRYYISCKDIYKKISPIVEEAIIKEISEFIRKHGRPPSFHELYNWSEVFKSVVSKKGKLELPSYSEILRKLGFEYYGRGARRSHLDLYKAKEDLDRLIKIYGRFPTFEEAHKSENISRALYRMTYTELLEKFGYLDEVTRKVLESLKKSKMGKKFEKILEEFKDDYGRLTISEGQLKHILKVLKKKGLVYQETEGGRNGRRWFITGKGLEYLERLEEKKTEKY